MGGGGTKGSTLVAIKTGGRRWAALFAGLTFITLIVFLGPAGTTLPISALSGVMIYVGVGLFEWHILHWVRHSHTRVDGIVALLVVATTVVYGLMDGVAVGVFGSIALLLLQDIKPEGREALKAIMRPLSLKHRKTVFNCGEYGDAIYLILKGEVEMRLPTQVYHYKRLDKRGPGTCFGGTGFPDPGPRAATAFVTKDVKLLTFDRQSMKFLSRKQQWKAERALLYALGASQAHSLRLAIAELRRLERW